MRGAALLAMPSAVTAADAAAVKSTAEQARPAKASPPG
jgi:hypothetical protein